MSFIGFLLGSPVAATPPNAKPGQPDVFTADDADYLGIAERLRYSCIPEHAKLGAWIIAKHQQFGGGQVPISSEHFNPNTAFARSW